MGNGGKGSEQISQASIAAPQGLLPWGPSTRNKPAIGAPKALHIRAIMSFLALCPLNRPRACQAGSLTVLENIISVWLSGSHLQRVLRYPANTSARSPMKLWHPALQGPSTLYLSVP